jgi:D-arginine dehydrogenase
MLSRGQAPFYNPGGMGMLDCDILIVGAGLAGAATAFHLRGRCGRVVVVEQEDLPGAHSSGRNAAMVRERVEEPEVAALVREGAAFLREQRLAEFRRTGSVLLGMGDMDVSLRVPVATGRGLWCPGDGIVDVNGLLHAYLRGQDVRYGTRVRSWRAAERAVEVDTPRGTIRCRLLVNAAGPWAGELGGLPVTPMNRHLFFTPPMAAVDPAWPFVWDIPDGFYFRPESGGLLLSACDESPAVPGDYRTGNAPLERLADLSRRVLPGLGEFAIRETWVGQRVFAPDRQIVIGHDSRCRSLFHVAALGGHGVTASWAVGRLAAERIVRGHTEPTSPFSPARLLAQPTAPAERPQARSGRGA